MRVRILTLLLLTTLALTAQLNSDMYFFPHLASKTQ